MSPGQDFAEWLRTEKGFTRRAVSDAKSRLKRAESLVGIDVDIAIRSEYRLLKLLDQLAKRIRDNFDEKIACLTYHQLKYTVRLYAEFKGRKYETGGLKKYAKRQRWMSSNRH
jgi:N-glycosylase/DNA lyase